MSSHQSHDFFPSAFLYATWQSFHFPLYGEGIWGKKPVMMHLVDFYAYIWHIEIDFFCLYNSFTTHRAWYPSKIKCSECLHTFLSILEPDLKAGNERNSVLQQKTAEKKMLCIKMAPYSHLLFLNNFQIKCGNREMVFLTDNSANTMCVSQARVI